MKSYISTEELYLYFLKYPSVQTDTRKLKQGDLFFALKGPNFNGNEFASKAIEQGAAFAIVDEIEFATTDRTILVEDVLTSLQQLAKYHRQQFDIPVLAITGSNGKTTSKELIHAVISSTYKTYTTQGNLNNHIGVPLTLLSIQSDAEFAIIEMGANHQKEIASYCSYTLPTHGLITNCGKAHLEGFGGVEGVKKGKGELYDFIRQSNGTIFRYNDYDYLHTMSANIKNVYTYGTNSHATIIGKAVKSEPFLEVAISEGANIATIQTQLVGEYNLPNVLSAVAIGKYFKVEDQKIKSAIENYQPNNSRSQLIQLGTNQIILDAYNANPTSMKAAIENFAKMPVQNKVLMIGGMMELGEESIQEHESIIQLILHHTFSMVVLVGGDFKQTNHPFIYFENSLEAAQWFKTQQFNQHYILIKGSRSMQMEKIIQ